MITFSFKNLRFTCFTRSHSTSTCICEAYKQTHQSSFHKVAAYCITSTQFKIYIVMTGKRKQALSTVKQKCW